MASRTTSRPATRAVPASGERRVERIRTVVVLPAPLGPSTPRTVPGAASRSTPSSARTSPNDLDEAADLDRWGEGMHPGSLPSHLGQLLSSISKKMRSVSETTSSRLLTLLSLLQGRRDWPGGELADRLEVSGRTVRRDIDRLRELGYPVESLTGPTGGYRLAAGTALPPLLLDDEEAIAIAVGLRTAARASVTGIEETSVRALVKLEQVLPSHLRRRVQALGVGDDDARARRRADRRPAGADADRRGVPRPRARALRLPGPRGRAHAPRGRAALARQRRPPLVPGRVGLRARRLAHVPRRPDRPPALPARASGRASCRPRTARRTSPRACPRGRTATRRG